MSPTIAGNSVPPDLHPAMAPSAGYSGTPLARKLGFKPGFVVCLVDPPAGYRDGLAPLPPGVRFVSKLGADVDLVQGFLTRRAALADLLGEARRSLPPDAMLWVSWPKKASKVASEITEDTVRELALPLGFVDVKVCAVDAVWSGLKLVVRKALR